VEEVLVVLLLEGVALRGAMESGRRGVWRHTVVRVRAGRRGWWGVEEALVVLLLEDVALCRGSKGRWAWRHREGRAWAEVPGQAGPA
jgi:hypothetical protein